MALRVRCLCKWQSACVRHTNQNTHTHTHITHVHAYAQTPITLWTSAHVYDNYDVMCETNVYIYMCGADVYSLKHSICMLHYTLLYCMYALIIFTGNETSPSWIRTKCWPRYMQRPNKRSTVLVNFHAHNASPRSFCT